MIHFLEGILYDPLVKLFCEAARSHCIAVEWKWFLIQTIASWRRDEKENKSMKGNLSALLIVISMNLHLLAGLLHQGVYLYQTTTCALWRLEIPQIPCLLNCLFNGTSMKTQRLCVTSPLWWKTSAKGWYPDWGLVTQNVFFLSWRRHRNSTICVGWFVDSPGPL